MHLTILFAGCSQVFNCYELLFGIGLKQECLVLGACLVLLKGKFLLVLSVQKNIHFTEAAGVKKICLFYHPSAFRPVSIGQFFI